MALTIIFEGNQNKPCKLLFLLHFSSESSFFRLEKCISPTHTVTKFQMGGNRIENFWCFTIQARVQTPVKDNFSVIINFFLFLNKIHFFLLSSVEETSNLCYRLNKNQLKLSLLSKIELKDGVTLVPEKLSWVSSDLANICKASLFQALSITYTQLH